jgi:hypothetical protein
VNAADVVLAGLILSVFAGLAGLIILNPGNLGNRGRAPRRQAVSVVILTAAVTVPAVAGVVVTAPNAHGATVAYMGVPYMGVPVTSPDGGTRVPCTTEDSGARGCVHDGRHMGNLTGRSFVLPTGDADDRVTYVSHNRARALLTGK